MKYFSASIYLNNSTIMAFSNPPTTYINFFTPEEYEIEIRDTISCYETDNNYSREDAGKHLHSFDYALYLYGDYVAGELNFNPNFTPLFYRHLAAKARLALVQNIPPHLCPDDVISSTPLSTLC